MPKQRICENAKTEWIFRGWAPKDFVIIDSFETQLKVLNDSHVPNDTNPQELEQIVGQVAATNIIEDELIEDGMGHSKSLHITMECKGMIIARVLINNGSPFLCAL